MRVTIMINQLVSVLLFIIFFAAPAAFSAEPSLITAPYPGWWLDKNVDYGYCGQPERDEHGKIKRSEEVKAAFMAIHPCPSTGLRTGVCPDWSMDHTRPLACGGCDSVSNLAWLHKSVKSAAAKPGFYPKDRIERKVYGLNPPIADTDNCTYVTPERTLK